MDAYAMKATCIFVVSCLFFFGSGYWIGWTLNDKRRIEKARRSMCGISEKHRRYPNGTWEGTRRFR